MEWGGQTCTSVHPSRELDAILHACQIEIPVAVVANHASRRTSLHQSPRRHILRLQHRRTSRAEFSSDPRPCKNTHHRVAGWALNRDRCDFAPTDVSIFIDDNLSLGRQNPFLLRTDLDSAL